MTERFSSLIVSWCRMVKRAITLSGLLFIFTFQALLIVTPPLFTCIANQFKCSNNNGLHRNNFGNNFTDNNLVDLNKYEGSSFGSVTGDERTILLWNRTFFPYLSTIVDSQWPGLVMRSQFPSDWPSFPLPWSNVSWRFWREFSTYL